MDRDARVCDNWALQTAQERAVRGGVGVVVVALVRRGATLRAVGFALRGLREAEADLARLGVGFFLLTPSASGGAGDGGAVAAFAAGVGAPWVVCDASPLREHVAGVAEVARLVPAAVGVEEVDTHNIVRAPRGVRTPRPSERRADADVEGVFARGGLDDRVPSARAEEARQGPHRAPGAGLPRASPLCAAAVWRGTRDARAQPTPHGVGAPPVSDAYSCPRSGDGAGMDWGAVVRGLQIDESVPQASHGGRGRAIAAILTPSRGAPSVRGRARRRSPGPLPASVVAPRCCGGSSRIVSRRSRSGAGRGLRRLCTSDTCLLTVLRLK